MILVGDITPSVFYDRQRCRCVGDRWDLCPAKGRNIIKTVTTAWAAVTKERTPMAWACA